LARGQRNEESSLRLKFGKLYVTNSSPLVPPPRLDVDHRGICLFFVDVNTDASATRETSREAISYIVSVGHLFHSWGMRWCGITNCCFALRTVKNHPVRLMTVSFVDRANISSLLPVPRVRQVQPRNGGTPYKGVYRSLVRMWKEEGFRGFMRGNGIVRIAYHGYTKDHLSSFIST
jgi:hypothetical protein